MTFKFELMDTWKRGVAWAEQIPNVINILSRISCAGQFYLSPQIWPKDADGIIHANADISMG